MSVPKKIKKRGVEVLYILFCFLVSSAIVVLLHFASGILSAMANERIVRERKELVSDMYERRARAYLKSGLFVQYDLPEDVHTIGFGSGLHADEDELIFAKFVWDGFYSIPKVGRHQRRLEDLRYEVKIRFSIVVKHRVERHMRLLRETGQLENNNAT